MIEGGYILLARKLLNSDIMNKPPHYLKLWIWMLGKAFYVNGDKLQKGQLFTTISEMQDACGYLVGARRERPTKDQIRNCYEHLTNANMITTAKTTRGLLITICNYDYYQNPKNYEHHSENSTKPTRTPKRPHTIEEEVKEVKEETPSSPSGEVDERYYESKKGKRLTGKRLDSFERFWTAFGYKTGKAEAADAWMAIPALTDGVVNKIVTAASAECARRPDIIAQGKTPKMAQGWLTGRRWEDEGSVNDKPGALRGAN